MHEAMKTKSRPRQKCWVGGEKAERTADKILKNCRETLGKSKIDQGGTLPSGVLPSSRSGASVAGWVERPPCSPCANFLWAHGACGIRCVHIYHLLNFPCAVQMLWWMVFQKFSWMMLGVTKCSLSSPSERERCLFIIEWTKRWDTWVSQFKAYVELATGRDTWNHAFLWASLEHFHEEYLSLYGGVDCDVSTLFTSFSSWWIRKLMIEVNTS